MTSHVYAKHNACVRSHCNICDGGLQSCTVCNGAEGTLTADCPGYALSDFELTAVYTGRINFEDGHWVDGGNFQNSTPLQVWFSTDPRFSHDGTRGQNIAITDGTEVTTAVVYTFPGWDIKLSGELDRRGHLLSSDSWPAGWRWCELPKID